MFAGISVPQCGQVTEGATGFWELDNSPPIAFLCGRWISAVFFSAVIANSINLESVAGGQVVMLSANFLFYFSNLGGEKLHRSTALRAHHVVMIASVVLVLVTGDTVVESHLTGKAAAGQEFQCPVHGGKADAVVFLLHEAVQLVRRKMFASFEKSAEDGVALLRLLQADASEMAEKYFLGLANAFARDAGLIVDTLL